MAGEGTKNGRLPAKEREERYRILYWIPNDIDDKEEDELRSVLLLLFIAPITTQRNDLTARESMGEEKDDRILTTRTKV